MHHIASKNFGIIFSDLEDKNIPEKYHEFLLELVKLEFDFALVSHENIKWYLKDRLKNLPYSLVGPGEIEPTLAIGFQIKWWPLTNIRDIKNDFDSYYDVPNHFKEWNRIIPERILILLKKYDIHPKIFWTTSEY